MAIKTTILKAAEFLKTPQEIADYLEEAFADGDPAFIAAALGDAARASGMAKIASETGLSRESLYRALGEKGNPTLATVLKVMSALGLRVMAAPTEKVKN